jgi:hypothetical protein
MALGQIPWRDTLIYGQHYGFSGFDLESLIDLIERLDLADLKLQAKDQPKNGKNRPPSRRD